MTRLRMKREKRSGCGATSRRRNFLWISLHVSFGGPSRGLEPYIRVSAKQVGVVEQLRHTQQGKLTSKQFADSGLWYIKKLFELTGSESLPFDELEDVLMQIRLQLKLQTVLLAHIKLIENASPGSVGNDPVGVQFAVSLSHVAVHGAV